MVGDGKFVCEGGNSTATRHGTGTGATRGSRGREVQTKLAVVDACDPFGWFVCGGGGAGCRGRGRGVRNEQTWLNANAGRAMMLLRDKKQKFEGAAPGNTFLMTWPCGRNKISAQRTGNRKIEFCFL